ncbi:unnamed protein product, partial [Ectocarpus sp. 4 AP-2014]
PDFSPRVSREGRNAILLGPYRSSGALVAVCCGVPVEATPTSTTSKAVVLRARDLMRLSYGPWITMCRAYGMVWFPITIFVRCRDCRTKIQPALQDQFKKYPVSQGKNKVRAHNARARSLINLASNTLQESF